MKKISRLIAFLALSVSFVTPLLANAQINTTAIQGYSDGIINIINDMFVPALMAIAFIVFLWGVYKYFILGAADEKSRIDGRQFTLWSIIGFVVIVSVWAIVNLFMGTLGLSADTAPKFPTLGAPSSGSTGSTGLFGGTGGYTPPVYPAPGGGTSHVNGTSCTGTGVEGYAVSGTWQNNICVQGATGSTNVNGTSCTGTGVEGYAVSGTWSNGTCITD